MRYITIILLLSTAFAQVSQEIRLNEVNIEGNTTTNADLIRYTAGLRPGNLIKTGDFARGVKTTLVNAGILIIFKYFLDEETPEGISITIKVIESPNVRKGSL